MKTKRKTTLVPQIGPSDFGTIFRTLTKKSGLEQKELAKIMGVSAPYINLLYNKPPAVPKIETIAKLFYLFDGFYITLADDNLDGKDADAFYGFKMPSSRIDYRKMLDEAPIDILVDFMKRIVNSYELVFPTTSHTAERKATTAQPTLTKLEAFTMAAMQGLCSTRKAYDPDDFCDMAHDIARDALTIALATLEEMDRWDGEGRLEE